MQYQNLFAVGYLTIFNSINTQAKVKKAPIIPAEEQVYKIGIGSNTTFFDVSAFKTEILFNSNRYAIFNIYIQPVIKYDYIFYWSPKTQGTKLEVRNFSLQFNYITTYAKLGDSGPEPSWASKPFNSYVLKATNEDPMKTYLLSLENFNYNLDSQYSDYRDFPNLYYGQTYLNKIMLNDTGRIHFNDFSYTYYAQYYNSKNNIYVDYTSKSIKPYDSRKMTEGTITINDSLKSNYIITNVKKLDALSLDAFNDNFVNQDSISKDILNITKEGLTTASQNEYNRGYKDGVANGQASAGEIPWLVSVFNSIDRCLSIEIFPGLKLWYVVAIPIIFSLIAFVLSFFR